METKKYTKFNETKSWFFEKINEIDKSLAKLTKRRENLLFSVQKSKTTSLSPTLYKNKFKMNQRF
jgi:hypothetical protein